jgi:hypothetical protein
MLLRELRCPGSAGHQSRARLHRRLRSARRLPAVARPAWVLAIRMRSRRSHHSPLVLRVAGLAGQAAYIGACGADDRLRFEGSFHFERGLTARARSDRDQRFDEARGTTRLPQRTTARGKHG